MSCHGIKRLNFCFAAASCALIGVLLAMGPTARAGIIVNDSWADGGRNNGADPLDTNWWSSVSSTGTGIEVSAGSLGLVTGSSGRGIHGIFPTQTLANVGDSLVATYTFTTPATVGTAQTAGFRVGLFDTLGRSGLDADVTSSSTQQNALYGYYAATPTPTVGLPGYMLDMDVGTGTEDFNIRQLDSPVNVPAQTPTGRLMGTTTGFTSVGNGPDGAFTFAPNTTYTGSLTITRATATDMQVIGTLGAATFSIVDPFDSADIGMIAFWANSNVFGTANTSGAANNGIDFSNIKIEFNPVPEPATLTMLSMAGLLLAIRTGRRKAQ
jgi:hypothetical protein